MAREFVCGEFHYETQGFPSANGYRRVSIADQQANLRCRDE
jgi:hypothetical protein